MQENARAAPRLRGLPILSCVWQRTEAPTGVRILADARLVRKDFDEFLFAPVGEDAGGTPLTLLSLLARLSIDPWEEAAELSIFRASRRCRGWPRGSKPCLTGLQHPPRIGEYRYAPDRASSSCAGAESGFARARPPLGAEAGQYKGLKLALYWLIGLLAVLVAQWALAARHARADGHHHRSGWAGIFRRAVRPREPVWA